MTEGKRGGASWHVEEVKEERGSMMEWHGGGELEY